MDDNAQSNNLWWRRGLMRLKFDRMTAATCLIFSVCVVAIVRADDWPQWLGPNRDDIWRETGIIDKFPKDGPPVRWRTPIDQGYSGPAVADGRVFVTDHVTAAKEKKAAGNRGPG